MVPVGRLVILRTRAEARAGRLARLADRAGADRPGDRPAGRRLHHHLFRLARGSSGSTFRSACSAWCWRRSTSPTSAARRASRFDRLGFVLSALGLAGVHDRLDDARPRPAAAAAGRWSLLVGGARCSSPMSSTAGGRRIRSSTCRSSRIPTFRHSLIGALLFRIGIGATPFLLPLLLQVGFGMTPFQSGMITFAVGDRRDRHEVRRAADPPPLRLPQRAHRQHAHRRRLRRAAGGLHAGDAGRADDRAPPHRRLLPLAAVHQRSTRSPSPTCRRSG